MLLILLIIIILYMCYCYCWGKACHVKNVILFQHNIIKLMLFKLLVSWITRLCVLVSILLNTLQCNYNNVWSYGKAGHTYWNVAFSYGFYKEDIFRKSWKIKHASSATQSTNIIYYILNICIKCNFYKEGVNTTLNN